MNVPIVISCFVVYLLSMCRMLWYARRRFNDPWGAVDFTDFVIYSIWTYVPLMNTIGSILTFINPFKP